MTQVEMNSAEMHSSIAWPRADRRSSVEAPVLVSSGPTLSTREIRAHRKIWLTTSMASTVRAPADHVGIVVWKSGEVDLSIVLESRVHLQNPSFLMWSYSLVFILRSGVRVEWNRCALVCLTK